MTSSFRDIRLFVAAYEERSFTAAASREMATQSGVSQHIRKLEDQFRVKLFQRSNGRISPTPAGSAYYAQCLEVLRTHEAAEAAVARFSGGVAGEIRIGLMPTMTRSVLAPALARFSALNPNVAITVTEAYSGVLTAQVRAGAFDFAIVPALSEVAGVRTRPFIRTPEVLVSARDSRHIHMQPVRLGDSGPIKLILPSRSNTRRQTLETYFVVNGVVVERMMVLDAMMGTLDLVSRTDWLTILPGIMMSSDVEHQAFTINPLADPPLLLDLVMIEPARRMLPQPAAAFFEMLVEAAGEVNRCWHAPFGGLGKTPHAPPISGTPQQRKSRVQNGRRKRRSITIPNEDR